MAVVTLKLPQSGLDIFSLTCFFPLLLLSVAMLMKMSRKTQMWMKSESLYTQLCVRVIPSDTVLRVATLPVRAVVAAAVVAAV